ncbi:TetR/AcrR family transcriptional regulator [Micromonospora sp. WMMD1120]|uniref:TetR/AcrR family transcriptional regulator n=1 Tax=Micromonospora sp. WMMD1120 TaxID=3016106 RepID=UPI002415A1F0|nr:TetR/AcrR family transcriptional regulator [Micromonospora sp. WMMD1120]MDG4810976.1 TetR/AcrR family transcriptional regulator [Micromonospora sp. WMMD1120]
MVITESTARRRGRPSGTRGAELLGVARELFLTHGFAATTMDAVAAAARISKASLYAQHPSKGALYAAVVTDWASRGRDAMRPHLDALVAAPDLPAALGRFGRTLQAAVLSSGVLRMRRLVAAEADRHPEVAARYASESWDRNIAALAAALAELHDRGSLRVDDPAVAAQQFTWLLLGAALNDRTLRGEIAPQEDLSTTADAAVATFLARYGPAGVAPRR